MALPDQEAWAKAIEAGSPLDPGGWASHWSLASRKKAVIDYGRWLSWLESQGALDPSLAPSTRATKERVVAFLADIQTRLSPFAVQSALQGLGDMLRVMVQTDAFGWITRGASRLRTCATSVKNKRQKLRRPDALIHLGRRLMEEAEVTSDADMPAAALQFRNGLIIALLAYRPMRVANLAPIEIGKHLVRQREGWLLIFGDGETKQRRRVEFRFPDKLNAALDRYLARYRPALADKGAHRGSAGSALWISHDGGAFTAGGINQAICRLTKDAFGAPINPHLFRDCAATMIAIDDPGHIMIIPSVLGQASMATSERHYNQARSVEGARQYHQALAARRREVRRNQEPKRAGS